MRSRRRLVFAVGWLAVALAPLALLPMGVLARPMDPLPPNTATAGIGTFATTVIAGGLTSAGGVGASGGLVTIDSGSAYVRARLDSGPSSSVLASPAEPGTLARSVVGVANCPALDPRLPQCIPEQLILRVPDAQAQYPGTSSAQLNTNPTSAGPLSTGGGSASAHALATSASGETTASSTTVTGAYDGSGSTSTAQLSRAGNQVDVAGTSAVQKLSVAGALTIHDIRGSAAIHVKDGQRMAEAGVTIGSASAGGIPVTIDDSGVHAVSQSLPFGTVQQATDQANQQLTGAGIQIHTVGAIHTVSPTGAFADSGGVAITITTPNLPVPGNTMTLYVGRVVETESDGPAAPALTLPPPVAPIPPSTTTVDIPAVPGVPGTAATTAAPSTEPASSVLVIGGFPLTAAQALLAFGIWQLLTMSPPTLTTLVRRRRRARLDEEEAGPV
jgi:hypothetical protein